MAIVLTLVTNSKKYTKKKQYKHTVNTSTHITKTPTQLSKHPHITKPTNIHTHILQNKLTQLLSFHRTCSLITYILPTHAPYIIKTLYKHIKISQLKSVP